MTDLSAKGAIVTGSSRGIGAEVAKILAAQGAGVVIDHRQKAPRANKIVAAITEAGGRAVAVGADLTTLEGPCSSWLVLPIENFGSLDVLVMNALWAAWSPAWARTTPCRLNRDAQVCHVAVRPPEKMAPPGSRRGLRDQPPGALHEPGPRPWTPRDRSVRSAPSVPARPALRERSRSLEAKGITFVVVSGGHDRGHHHRDPAGPCGAGRHRGPPRRRRQAVLRLSRNSVPRWPQWSPPMFPTGHTEYVGGAGDFLKK